MKTLYLFAVAMLSIVLGSFSFGQIAVTSGQTAQQLAEFLAGPNITVTGASLTGASNASGQFTGVNSSVGFDSGIILSTGSVLSNPGCNNRRYLKPDCRIL